MNPTSSPDTPRCATCRFWQENEFYGWEGRDIETRHCAYAPELWEATTWSREADKQVLLPEHKDVLAFVQDGSSYKAALLTKADFGCVAHQPAEAS